jgi:hypothetical protein
MWRRGICNSADFENSKINNQTDSDQKIFCFVGVKLNFAEVLQRGRLFYWGVVIFG